MALSTKPDKTSRNETKRNKESFGIKRLLTVGGTLILIAGCLSVLAMSYSKRGKQRAQALEIECKAALEAEEWAELEVLAEEWAALEEERPQPWMYAAEAASRQGKQLKVGAYLSLLPDVEESMPGLLELSHLQFGNLNQPAAAAETCERILGIEPKHPEAHRRLIFYYAMSRQRAKMVEEARRAIKHGGDIPETYLYLVGADWIAMSNGPQVNTRWLESDPKSETFEVARAYHFVRTTSMAQEEDSTSIGEAAQNHQVMVQLLAKYPHNSEALTYHLELAAYQGDLEQVVKLLKNASTETANDSRFWRFKGWVHQEQQELDEAVASYKKALELHPFDWKSQHELAAAFRLKGVAANVERYQKASVLGKELSKELLRLPSTQALTDRPELLARIVEYAKASGDAEAANRLENRIAEKLAPESS